MNVSSIPDRHEDVEILLVVQGKNVTAHKVWQTFRNHRVHPNKPISHGFLVLFGAVWSRGSFDTESHLTVVVYWTGKGWRSTSWYEKCAPVFLVFSRREIQKDNDESTKFQTLPLTPCLILLASIEVSQYWPKAIQAQGPSDPKHRMPMIKNAASSHENNTPMRRHKSLDESCMLSFHTHER